MASSVTTAPTTSVVEHVVYLKGKATTSPETFVRLAQELQALEALEGVIQLRAGPAVEAGHGGWTFALHGRYASKEALDAYSVSDAHVRVVNTLVKPNIDGVMAVDWEASVPPSSSISTAKVVHSLAFKLKEGADEAKFAASLAKLQGAEGENLASAPIQGSSGPNFAPARSQGHNWGLVLLHRTEEDAKAWLQQEQVRKVLEEEVLPLTDGYASVPFKADIPVGAEANL